MNNIPYIKKEERPRLDKLIDPLIDHLKNVPTESQDGEMNYLITRLLKVVYTRKYFNLNRAMGVLTCVASEFYRRVVGPYEDEKIKENGDVK